MGRYVVRMGETRNAHKIVVGNLKVRMYLRHTKVDWRIKLKPIIKEWNVDADCIQQAQDRIQRRLLVNTE
jgi:hypothetical protein